MKRAIKFKLKNGRVVTIRRLVATDYDAQMKFMEKFTLGPGAVQTMQYRGQPKKNTMSANWTCISGSSG